jgi:Kef-type K+ transport system membrane component KefB
MISLAQTAILLAAAVVAVSLFRFLRLSSILGYVAAGLVIGPWGLNLIGEVGRILQVSQFGTREAAQQLEKLFEADRPPAQ